MKHPANIFLPLQQYPVQKGSDGCPIPKFHSPTDLIEVPNKPGSLRSFPIGLSGKYFNDWYDFDEAHSRKHDSVKTTRPHFPL